MRLAHLFEKVAPDTETADLSKDKTFWEMVDRIDAQLPYEAQDAISKFVGGGTDKDENTAIGFGFMFHKHLEKAYGMVPDKKSLLIRQQLADAMAPIRKYLKDTYGDRVDLHRGYAKHNPSSADDATEVRNLLSFTTEHNVAKSFAGVMTAKGPKVLTDEQIDQLVQKYQNTGQVKIFGYRYVRNWEKFPETKMGLVKHPYEQYVIEHNGQKHPVGGVSTRIWNYLIQQDAFEGKPDMSQFDRIDMTGTIRSEAGEEFKVYKETIEQEVMDRIPTGKIINFLGCDIYSIGDGTEDDEGDEHLTGIDGDPESVRESIVSVNNERKEMQVARDDKLKRVKTFPIPVDNIVWVTDRFFQQEFIVFVGSDAEKSFPKFDS
jgi:hypothetical protein